MEIAIFRLKLTTEAVLLTHYKYCLLMTKRMVVAGYIVDPRHEQKREKLWGCE